ncbi:MAG: HD-GYP domain-containing protein [Phycisphaerae bacterium]
MTRDQCNTTPATHPRVSRSNRLPRRACLDSMQALVVGPDAKDVEVRNHSLRVAEYAQIMGRRMRLRPSVIDSLNEAALMHDIGKLAVPESILRKPGPLSIEEFEVIARHPAAARDILGHLRSLSRELSLILHHHERYDGQGYPAGLAGIRIPLEARILAVADALDAMCSSRSYKPAYSLQRVRSELVAGAGRQFDPDVTRIALSWLDEAAARRCGRFRQAETRTSSGRLRRSQFAEDGG